MTDFAPAFWLRNRHVQSILPSFPLRRRGVTQRAAQLLDASVEHILDCGEGVRLMGLHATQERLGKKPATQLAVLIHGWEGSADSLYLLSLGRLLLDRGFDVFRLNLRDHGPTHHLNRELFHSCRLDEVVGAVRRIQALFPDRELNLAGFSLGGNFALRVGARAGSAGLNLRRIVAVSPVLDPEVTLESLENGLPVYRKYFVRKWTRSLLNKQKAWPGVYDFAEIRRTPTLTYMTDRLVRQHTDFPDLQSYLRGYGIVDRTLESLTVPSLIIASQDDPIIHARDLKRLARNEALRIRTTPRGGHCGFIETLGADSWVARQVLTELEKE